MSQTRSPLRVLSAAPTLLLTTLSKPRLIAKKNRRRQRNREAYPRHLEIPQDTPTLPTQYAPVPDLRRPRVAVHLRQLQLGLGPRPRGQRRVADDVAQRLPADTHVSVEQIPRRVRSIEAPGHLFSYLCVSASAKAFRFEWSRMTLMLTNEPMSSFLARNIDILTDIRLAHSSNPFLRGLIQIGRGRAMHHQI